MSRIITNFPWVWNSLTGVQPSYKLDDDYNAVPEGSITIRTQVLAADYTLVADDDYSCFLCLPVANMSIFLPSSPGPSFSFFITNQSATKTVQIFGTISINGAVPVLNPILTPGALVTGGLVVWDGSSWSLYSQFSGVSPGAGVTSISKTGSPPLTGNVTFSQGANATVTQSGQDILIAATGGGGGSGTVTSVGLVGTGNQIAVAGATPITASGTFTLSIPANAQLSVAKLTNLTSNGFVKTNSADGTLSVDGNTYILAGGNAGTATALQTPRTINGVSFDGSANITVTAAGSTLSDTVTVAKGGTGLTALGSALQVLRVNAGGTALEYAAASGGGTPGGSTTQVQYNNAGAFGGITGATTNGTALTLVAPVLGTPASVTLTNGTGLPISTGVSGLGTGAATALAVNVGSAGAFVTFNGALGTPSSGTLTSATGLPISTGVSGLGTNVATFLATPSSANLAAALTDETGTGANVFATSPTLVTPTTDSLTISGNQSVAAWTTNGVRLKSVAGTLTDTTSSGTVAAAYTNVLGGNTIAASSATTFTDYYSMFLKDPIAGTNVTLTNKWALGVESMRVIGNIDFPVRMRGTTGGGIIIGSYDANYGGIWPSNVTPGISNYMITGSNGATQINAGTSPGIIYFNIGDSTVANIKTTGLGINKGSVASGAWIDIAASANTTALKSTGYSITGSGTTAMLDLAGTLNNGSTVLDVVKIAITNTATGAASKLLNLYAGASGTTSVFSVGVTGIISALSLSLQAGGLLSMTSTGGAAVVGTATLTAGTVTVSTTAAVTGTKIFIQRKSSGGTIGMAITYTISSGTSFTINSDNPLDTSTFDWHFVGAL